ncbi:Rne/Rng family ribonuclease [Glaciibacter sp. 2TAF33]|uniref:Rne/Rng family ribonuclease n=1 Tax=Glaciibacter sp. 2TAF33 TaxID=3233015 RepID=UPI003F939F9D
MEHPVSRHAATPVDAPKADAPKADAPKAAAPVDAPSVVEPAGTQAAPEPVKSTATAEPAATETATQAAEPQPEVKAIRRPTTSLIFQAPEILPLPPRQGTQRDDRHDDDDDEPSSIRRRARRRSGEENRGGSDDPANTVVKVRTPREPELITEPQRIKGSTRLEAKKQRRRDGRDAGRRRPVITEAEFLARRESVDRVMVVRAKHNKIQIGVLEDGVLVEHYVAKNQDASLIGNVYLGRVQNVLPSMEAAFVDIGRGRNAVLYSGEVDWDAAAENSTTANQARRIELALKPGDKVLVQVSKDPVGHKGARLTSQVSLPGRYLVYVPNGSMNGISRKLPDTERARLKKILKEVLPDNAGVIVRTAAEGATDEQLGLDVSRLTAQWASIAKQVESVQAPALLHSEPDLLIKIVRDVFNEDFQKMVVSGEDSREIIESYLRQVAPDLVERIERYEGERDAFDEYRISEQIEKALDRKVWLPSGGSLVIDRTEAMTVVDVNTGKFVGSGGNLEETVTKNNLEAAEEIVRQLRLRDIGGIIVVDFIDMVLESNRDLVLRRLIECLSRDRTKHQVAEVTSLGLVQMTRKKLGLGLLESFSENCEVCAGRGIIVHHDPVIKHRQSPQPAPERRSRSGRSGNGGNGSSGPADAAKSGTGTHGITEDAKHALALIAASTLHTPTGSVAVVRQNGATPAGDSAAGNSTAGNSPAETADAATNAADQNGTYQGAAEQNAAGDNSAARSGAGRGRSDNGNRARAAAATADDAAADQSQAAPADSEQPGRRQGRRAQAERGQSRRDPSRREASQRGATQRETKADAATATSADVAADTAEAANPSEAVAAAATDVGTAAAVAPEAESVAILDIPVRKSPRGKRPVSKQVTEQLLDSVLEALPEPKQPGQGRSRSRRVTTAGGSTQIAPTIVTPSHESHS